MAAPFATQDKFTVIYSFNGTDGTTPTSGLTLGPHNAFYGSTSTLVFKLTLDAKHRWQQKKIAPAIASLVGTGTALYGVLGVPTGKPCPQNTSGCGEVVSLTPPAKGETAWTQTVLYEFKGNKDGASPKTLIVGSDGALYGTTVVGGGSTKCGSAGCGVVFKLVKRGKHWDETVIHAFQGGKDGNLPLAAPSLDPAGNVFITTNLGGGTSKNASSRGLSCEGEGIVEELAKESELLYHAHEVWKAACEAAGPEFAASAVIELIEGHAASHGRVETAHAPKQADGAIFTTEGGGKTTLCPNLDNNGCGVAALLTQPTNGSTPWTLKVLHNFDGDDGALPTGSMVATDKDTVYGVTVFGGSHKAGCLAISNNFGCGVVFKLVNKSGGWVWGGVVHRFEAADGAEPNTTLLFHNGKIFGTTTEGGTRSGGCSQFGCGTIFTITP
jgi:hypothetical protein